MALQKWRSHKVVEAAEIINYQKHQLLIVEDADGAEVNITPSTEFWKRFLATPTDRGYYVKYLDGFESWSPSEAFEDGYEPIDDEDIVTSLDDL